MDEMERALNPRRLPAIPAVTIQGEGVLETFSAVLARTMENLSSHFRLLAPEPSQTMEDWTRQTILGVFGKPTLAGRASEAEEAEPELEVVEDAGEELAGLMEIFSPSAQEPTIQRSVKVTLSPDAVAMAGVGPDARANETLVESYAQASVNLSLELESVRGERDAARRQVDDLRHSLLAVEALLLGHPRDVALRAVLARMAKACDCRVASLLGARADGSLGTVTGIGIARDLFLTSPEGPALLRKLFLPERHPRLFAAADDPGLAEVLKVATPPFASVLYVPLARSRLHGLAMLYFTSDARKPTPATVEHLLVMARPIATALETPRPAQRRPAASQAGA
jgi:hypothetical protein